MKKLLFTMIAMVLMACAMTPAIASPSADGYSVAVMADLVPMPVADVAVAERATNTERTCTGADADAYMDLHRTALKHSSPLGGAVTGKVIAFGPGDDEDPDPETEARS